MRTVIKKSLKKWLLFTVLGLMTFILGYFIGLRRGEIQQAAEQGALSPVAKPTI